MSKIGFIFLSSNQLPINKSKPHSVYLSCVTLLKFFNNDFKKKGIFLMDKTFKKYSYKNLRETLNLNFNIDNKNIQDIVTLPKKIKKVTIYLVLLKTAKIKNTKLQIESKLTNYQVFIENVLLPYKLPSNFSETIKNNLDIDLFSLIKDYHKNNQIHKINIYDNENDYCNIYLNDIIDALVELISFNA